MEPFNSKTTPMNFVRSKFRLKPKVRFDNNDDRDDICPPHHWPVNEQGELRFLPMEGLTTAHLKGILNIASDYDKWISRPFVNKDGRYAGHLRTFYLGYARQELEARGVPMDDIGQPF